MIFHFFHSNSIQNLPPNSPCTLKVQGEFGGRFCIPILYAFLLILFFFGQKNASSQPVDLAFSHPAGWHVEPFDLQIFINYLPAEIYYTLNGELPDTSSTRYDEAIFIEKKTTALSNAVIPTAPEYWQPAQGEVFQIMTIRAAGFLDGERITPYHTASYAVHELGSSRYPFPVVSLVTNGRHFFDAEVGIHIPGALGEAGNLQTGNHYQRGREWERPVHLEFFEADGTPGIAQDCGVRVHGQYSRQLPQKSMRLYAREEYGDKDFDYRSFPQKNIDDYKRLVLRTANPNNFHVPFKDELCHLLAREMGLEYQAFTPVVVFVNGEYWGIFNLKERHDRFYIQSNYGIDDDEVDMLERSGFVVDGEAVAWEEMMNFVRQNDLSTEGNYATINEYLHLDNFIDFVVAELYLELWDFPENNLKYWRERTPNARWRWLFNDGDSAMHEYWKSKIRELLTPLDDAYDDEPFVVLLRKLLTNETFKARFYQGFLYHLNHSLSPTNVLRKIDSLTNVYDPAMPEHIRRWGYPATMNDYHAAVTHIRQFAALRLATLVADLEAALGQPFEVFPNPVGTQLNIHLYGNTADNAVEYILYNSLGQDVLSGVFSENMPTLDVSGLANGVYFLHLKIAGICYAVKIIKT